MNHKNNEYKNIILNKNSFIYADMTIYMCIYVCICIQYLFFLVFIPFSFIFYLKDTCNKHTYMYIRLFACWCVVLYFQSVWLTQSNLHKNVMWRGDDNTIRIFWCTSSLKHNTLYLCTFVILFTYFWLMHASIYLHPILYFWDIIFCLCTYCTYSKKKLKTQQNK